MKKLWILLLALVMLTVMVSCNDEDPAPSDTDASAAVTTDPVATFPVTESTTELFTEAATEPVTDKEDDSTASVTTAEPETTAVIRPSASVILDAVIAKNEAETLSEFGFDMDTKLNISVHADGIQNSMGVNIGMDMAVQSNGNMALSVSAPSQEDVSLVWVDGVMYMSSGDGMYCADMAAEDIMLIFEEMMGTMMEDAEDMPAQPGTVDITAMLSMIKLTELFAEVNAETDAETGDTVLTFAGLSEQFNTIIAMIMGSAQDPEADYSDIDLVMDLIGTLDRENLQIIVTVDADLLIKVVAVNMTLDLTDAPELTGDVPMTIGVSMTATLDRTPQCVSAPENADEYIEVEWRELFGMETPEMLELVPGENGVYVLSSDSELLDRQLYYIYEHYEDFADAIFSFTGEVTLYESAEIAETPDAMYLEVSVPLAEGEYYSSGVGCLVLGDLAEATSIEVGATVTVTFAFAAEDIYTLIASAITG